VSASREIHSTIAARGVIGDMVRLRGLKRGLHDAAIALGVSESWARKIHYGEASAISAEVAERAAAARGVVLRARLEADRREIVEIESAIQGGNHGCDLQGAHASVLPARGLVR